MASQKVKLSVGELNTFLDYSPINGEICFVKHDQAFYSVGLMDQGNYIEVKDFKNLNGTLSEDSSSIILEDISFYDIYRNFSQSIGSTFHTISLSINDNIIILYPYKISSSGNEITMTFITLSKYYYENDIQYTCTYQLNLTFNTDTKTDVSSKLDKIIESKDKNLYWKDF